MCIGVKMKTFIALAAVLACFISPAWGQLDPEIVDEIIPEVTSQGESARLNCTVVNLQSTHVVVWDFLDAKTGGEPITRNEGIFITNPECEEDRKKYEVQKRVVGQRVTFMLVVNCLKIVNTGRYKCLIQIPGIAPQNWPSKIGYLTVQVPPTITSKNDAVVQLDTGQTATLLCTANGIPAPNITWVRSDGSSLPGIKGALLRNESLTLPNVTKHDRGLYRCVADNQVRPPDEYLVDVNVFFKPDTVAVQDSVGQAADRQFDAKLECRVSGFPEPELTWFMEPKNTPDNTRIQLNDNQRYDISKQIATTVLRTREAFYTLRIKNVVANDFTKYWCVAKNRLGTNDTTLIELFQTYECQGANCPSFEAQGASAVSMSVFLAIAMATVAKILV